MIVRGTWDWNLIKIETDSGLYGIGEAYWGWGVKDLVLNKMKPIVVGEDPLNVDKLYHQNADAERRRRRHRRRHRHGRQRHRDRPLGSLRAHSPNPGLQPARRPFPRPRPLLSHPAVRRSNVEDLAPWRALAESARAEKWGWTAFKFQGDGVPPQSRSPTYRSPATTPTRRNLTQQGLPAHRARHGNRARDPGSRTPISPSSATGATTLQDVIRLAPNSNR